MGDILIRVPEKHKHLADAVSALLDEVEMNVRTAAGGKVPHYDTIEEAIGEKSAAVERSAHQSILAALDIDEPRILVGGVIHRRVGHSTASYYTLGGSVSVPRTLYVKAGQKNGQTVDPVSLRAGVVGDGWLPATARAIAHLVQSATSRDAEKSASMLGRARYSRSSYERVAHQVGELYVADNERIEDELIRKLEVPREAHSIAVSIDRVSVPMEEPRKRPPGRPPKGAPKNPVYRNYRMAYAACLSICDIKGEALDTIRYGRMPAGDPVELCEGLAGDIMMLFRQRPDLLVAALADGAKENWNLFDLVLSEENLGRSPHRILDLFHLLEKLGEAAKVVFGQERKSAEVERWRLLLLNDKNAPSLILKQLRESDKEWTRHGDSAPVHDAITYLKNNADKMGYVEARELGLPVGSGHVEATCKSLFELRLKRCGSRWKNDTGEHIVQLRALALSDRWTDAMNLTLRPLQIPVRKAAA